jgi:hypothetical protein
MPTVFANPATQTEANDMTELNANKAAGVAGYATGLGKPPSLHTSLRKDQSGNPAGRSPKVGLCVRAQMVVGRIFLNSLIIPC